MRFVCIGAVQSICYQYGYYITVNHLKLRCSDAYCFQTAVTRSFSPVSRPSLLVSSTPSSAPLNSNITVGSNGSISTILPISEVAFNRLYMLQAKITNSVQHRAGLNPKAHRATVVAPRRFSPAQNLLDWAILAKYFQLSLNEQVCGLYIGACCDIVSSRVESSGGNLRSI